MEKLAAVTPFSTRPSSSQARVGAKAMTRKSTARPKIEISITGRRPNRSDSMPSTGPADELHHAPGDPEHRPASSPPRSRCRAPTNDLIRLGSTGIIRPNETAFITAVAKMKPNAGARPAAPAGAAVEARGALRHPLHLRHRPTGRDHTAPGAAPAQSAPEVRRRALVDASRVAPPFAMALEEDRVGEAMAGHVPGRHAVPAGVLDGDAGLRPDRLESHLDLGVLARREGRLAPAEHQPLGGSQARISPISNTLPSARVSIEPAASAIRPGLERQHAGAARGEVEQRGSAATTAPISPVKTAKARSGVAWTRSATRTREFTPVPRSALSRWALKAASCALHRRSVSSSQRFSSAIGSGLRR